MKKFIIILLVAAGATITNVNAATRTSVISNKTLEKIAKTSIDLKANYWKTQYYLFISNGDLYLATIYDDGTVTVEYLGPTYPIF